MGIVNVGAIGGNTSIGQLFLKNLGACEIFPHCILTSVSSVGTGNKNYFHTLDIFSVDDNGGRWWIRTTDPSNVNAVL